MPWYPNQNTSKEYGIIEGYLLRVQESSITLVELVNIMDNCIVESESAFLGQLTGAFVIMLILSYLTRWVIKNFSPETVGNTRVGISVGIPLIIASLLNLNMYFIYVLVALVIGFVFYQQEVKKTI